MELEAVPRANPISSEDDLTYEGIETWHRYRYAYDVITRSEDDLTYEGIETLYYLDDSSQVLGSEDDLTYEGIETLPPCHSKRK